MDIFAPSRAEFDFAKAVDAVVEAYRRAGLDADVEVRGASFARLNVRSSEEIAKVELGVDWRENEPVRLALGPVLHADDAVANKICALFGRAEVRFAEALSAIDRLPDSLFQPYGLGAADVIALRERMTAWAYRVRSAEG